MVSILVHVMHLRRGTGFFFPVPQLRAGANSTVCGCCSLTSIAETVAGVVMVPATDLLAMRIGMAGSDALLQLHNHEALLLFALLFAWHVNALRAFFIEFHSETPF